MDFIERQYEINKGHRECLTFLKTRLAAYEAESKSRDKITRAIVGAITIVVTGVAIYLLTGGQP